MAGLSIQNYAVMNRYVRMSSDIISVHLQIYNPFDVASSYSQSCGDLCEQRKIRNKALTFPLTLSLSLSPTPLPFVSLLFLSSTASMAVCLVSMVTKPPGIRSCQGDAGLLTRKPTENDFSWARTHRLGMPAYYTCEQPSRRAKAGHVQVRTDQRRAVMRGDVLRAHHFPDR